VVAQEILGCPVEGEIMKAKVTYKKHNSFHELYVTEGKTNPTEQTTRALKILTNYSSVTNQEKQILLEVEEDLQNKKPKKFSFSIAPFVADEMRLVNDEDIPRYLFHRYRYEIYPQLGILDEYPPYLQIEPSSVCNYRCVFCYQTDQTFSKNKSVHMGSMGLEMYKSIVDQAVGKIELLSLASRGEPLICKDFDKMMDYSIGKFLNLKVNTNASLLTEKLCHALLCGGAKTVVFSADAAEEKLYGKLRVNGKLQTVLKNIERFQKIRDTEYGKTPIITRVSGVLVDQAQNMESMKRLWSNLVDQISFVKYNPWENVYDSPLSKVKEPCSDLWRRMFIWFDGDANPCDTDYKSKLKVGNISEKSLNSLWQSSSYQILRQNHKSNRRNLASPCNKCMSV
jgi:radical SAM protein with 4Fe4S-binding SPASM domain